MKNSLIIIAMLTAITTAKAQPTWLGSGTQTDPWQISTLAQLEELADSVNRTSHWSWSQNKYFILMNDIDTMRKIIGINGTFQGHFNGNNFTITLDLNYDWQTASVGLFGRVGYPSTITNLTVAGNVKGYNNVGGIAGEVSSADSISRCINAANVTGTSYVGGITGMARYTTITYCLNIGDIIGSHVAGIVGCGMYGNINISYCVNYGHIRGIKASNDTHPNVNTTAGIIGHNAVTNTINTCINIGVIEVYPGGKASAIAGGH